MRALFANQPINCRIAERQPGSPASGLAAIADTSLLTTAASGCYAEVMVFALARILDTQTRLPFVYSGQLVLILGDPTSP